MNLLSLVKAGGIFKNLVVTTDDSNYKNYAVVAGSGEGDQRQKVIVDNSGGEKLKRLYVDARDLQKGRRHVTATI